MPTVELFQQGNRTGIKIEQPHQHRDVALSHHPKRQMKTWITSAMLPHHSLVLVLQCSNLPLHSSSGPASASTIDAPIIRNSIQPGSLTFYQTDLTLFQAVIYTSALRRRSANSFSYPLAPHCGVQVGRQVLSRLFQAPRIHKLLT